MPLALFELGVRILGEVTKEYADTLRLADDIFISELRAHDLYDRVSQAFVVFLPVKSAGVTEDGRRPWTWRNPGCDCQYERGDIRLRAIDQGFPGGAVGRGILHRYIKRRCD